MEGTPDTEYNFWALSLDTEIFCGLNTDVPFVIHITDKINASTYRLFKIIAIICVKLVLLNYTENQFYKKHSNNTRNSEKFSGSQFFIFFLKCYFRSNCKLN